MRKIIVSLMVVIIAFTSTNVNVFALANLEDLQVGEVTQDASAKWVDYENGIAEVSIDVVGKNVEEPLDVAIIYDNSGSMQTTEPFGGDYLTSRWYYASTATKTFVNSLLENKDSNVSLIPFSDVLIDGTTIHDNPTEYFETHKLIYDKNGNPDINKMKIINDRWGGVEKGKLTIDEFYQECLDRYGVTKEDLLEEANNVKNAVISFTKDKEQLMNAVNSLYPSHAGLTNYEIALLKAQEMFEKSDSNNRKIIVMISDGAPTSGKDGLKVANELKDTGVTIYTCGAGLDVKDANILKNIASKDGGIPLYTSSKPSELENTLSTLRKSLSLAAYDGVVKSEIKSENIDTDYFEYYTDGTHIPTVNNVAISDEELEISSDKGALTWKVGNISEVKKTLRYYIKVKDKWLNQELLDKDNSFLNKPGIYEVGKNSNLSYTEINTDNRVTEGHEIDPSKLEVACATLEIINRISDSEGNFIGNTVLGSIKNTNKALEVIYKWTPEPVIIKDGVTYHILNEDNQESAKIFSTNDNSLTKTYRYVEQMNVTFDTNENGEFEDSSIIKDIKVNHDTMTISQLPKVKTTTPGMHFVGWNTKKDGSGELFDTSYKVKTNMSVYAQYALDQFSVVFKYADNGVINSQTVEYGKNAIAPTVPTKDGYTFIGWDKDFTNITSDLEVIAQFDTNKYTVTFDGNGSTSGTMGNQEFTYDIAQKLNKNEYKRENYTFTGWLYKNKLYTDEMEVKNLVTEANGNVVFVAQWKENNKYNVIFKDDLGYVLKSTTVYEGLDAIAPITPTKDGYIFVGWDKDFTNVTSDLEVIAQFKANKYTVTFDGNGSTSGTMGNQEFTYDIAQKLNKNEYKRENYTFTGWLYQNKLYTDEMEVKNLVAEVNGNVVFVAQWKENNKYNVIFRDDLGNILKSTTVYEGLDAIAPTVPTKDGYTFVGWDKDFTNVISDLLVTAVYEENTAVIVPPTITPETPTPTLPTDTIVVPLVTPVVATPVVVNTPAVAQPPVVPNQEEQDVTQPIVNEEIIEDQEVPLAKISGSWALLNLICTVVVTLLGIFLVLVKLKKEDEDNAVIYKRRVWTKVTAAAISIVSIVAFIITENISLPMILTDKWTLMMVVLTLIQMAVVCVGYKWKEHSEQQDELID